MPNDSQCECSPQLKTLYERASTVASKLIIDAKVAFQLSEIRNFTNFEIPALVI